MEKGPDAQFSGEQKEEGQEEGREGRMDTNTQQQIQISRTVLGKASAGGKINLFPNFFSLVINSLFKASFF